MKEKKPKGEYRRVGYVFAVLANVVMLWIVNNVLNWHVPFVTESFVTVVPILTASILANVAANGIYLAYDPRWFVQLTKVALNLIGLAVTYIVWVLFPFDFGPWDSMAKLVMVLMMVGIGIAVIVELCKLIFGKD